MHMTERAPPRRRASIFGALVALLAALAMGAPAAKAVPADFWGTVSIAGHWGSDAEWDRIRSLGVRRFHFQYVQGGSWSELEAIVRRAAVRGITMQPVIGWNAPAGRRGFPKKGDATEYADFMRYIRESVQHFGPGGSFWSSHPELTPRPWKTWEVINEPNRRINNPVIFPGTEMPEPPQPHHYAQLLIDASATIRAVDPTATVLVGGLDFSSPDMSFEAFLNRMYEDVINDGAWGSHTRAQVKEAFDGLAIHPYEFRNTFADREAEIKRDIGIAREVLRANGDAGLPLYVTEMGWAVAASNLPAEKVVTPAEQARLLRVTWEWLALQSDVRYVVWYLYRDTPGPTWQDRSGLFDSTGNTREAACAFADLAGGYACGYETRTFATLTQILNGQPGYVSIGGEVLNTYPGGPAVNGVNVRVQFERREAGGRYVYVDSVEVPVVNGHYQYNFWGKGVGQWQTRTVLPKQGSFKASESGYHTFQIKSGYRLVSRSSGKCLSLSENNPRNGTAIIQWTCSPAPNPGDGQVMHLVPMEASGQYFQIKINSTGKCLDVLNGSTADGAWLQEYDCLGAGQTNQHFRVVPIAGQPPYEAFMARHSGKCLDVTGNSTVNGARIQQWGCHWGGNQQWYWQAIE
jgi:Ricin-type beta-trefoil lectin domain-like